MIYIFDFESQYRAHLPFNSAVVRIAAAAYPSRRVVFWGHHTHIVAQQDEMGPFPQTVSLRALPESLVTQSGATISPIGRARAIDYLKTIDLPRNTVILGAGGSLIDRLSSDTSLHSRSNFDIVFHATISALGHRRSLMSRLFRRDLFTIFGQEFPPQMRFVLLERAIERNLRHLVRSTTKTAVLEHPAEGKTNRIEALPTSEKLRIAFIGGATQAKGFSIFCQGASRKNPCVAYHCIGSAPPSYDSAYDHLLATPPQEAPLPQDEFDAMVRSMDLICLPLDPIYYSWAASGALADCIRFGVPFITIRNAVVSDLEARYGRVGYVFESAEQIPEFLEKIDRQTFESDRQAFEEAIGCIGRDRSIASLARSFRLNE